MKKLTLMASKDIYDATNPLPCVRIAFLSDFSDGAVCFDWDKWVDWVNEEYKRCKTDYVDLGLVYVDGVIDYERTLECANKWALLDFIEWL